MDLLLLTVIALVALALLFDFTNGFHDAANSVATVVATRVLPARWAPAFSAFFNFVAYFVVGLAVANTVSKVVDKEYSGVAVIFAALVGAITWNFVTWWVGMPSSSSHALIGGLIGAGLAAGGVDAISVVGGVGEGPPRHHGFAAGRLHHRLLGDVPGGLASRS